MPILQPKKTKAQPVRGRGRSCPKSGDHLCVPHMFPDTCWLVINREEFFLSLSFFSFGPFSHSWGLWMQLLERQVCGEEQDKQEMPSTERKVGSQNWLAPPCLRSSLYCIVAWRPGGAGTASPLWWCGHVLTVELGCHSWHCLQIESGWSPGREK